MGGLGGNKSSDNTDIMRENERDSRRANTGGGQGREAMMGKKKTGEVRGIGCAAELCKNGKRKHIK